MEYQKPERAVIRAWRLGRAITLAALSLAFAVAVIACVLSDGEPILLSACILLGLLVCYKLAGLFVYPLIEYRQWKYLILDEKIEISHGIFFIKRHIIPVIRIQNITVKQGPIYRRYGLYTVEIALASGTFEIVGLDRMTADGITERVRERLSVRLADGEER